MAMMTYAETVASEEPVMITRKRAELECTRHGATFADMVADLGDCDTYDARAVLAWLGY